MIIYRVFNDAEPEAESLYYESEDDANENCEATNEANQCDDWRVEACFVRESKETPAASETPHKCPVCHGFGQVLDPAPIGTAVNTVSCPACGGTGVLWR